nr:DUF6714 family protein [Xanthomonas sp. WHRI 8812E]
MGAGIDVWHSTHVPRHGKSLSTMSDRPPMSLRAGNAIDDHAEVPPFDAVRDQVTAEYLERYCCGIHHLDSVSWRFYLPHLLQHALRNSGNAASNATDTLLQSLRPPDREPPRFGSLSAAEERMVIAALDTLAFTDGSEWIESAQCALEEYWGPGASYR